MRDTLLATLFFSLILTSTFCQDLSNHKHDKGISFSKNKITVVLFCSENCGPCQGLQRQLKEIQAFLDTYFLIFKIDLDSNQEMAERFMVNSTPNLVFLNYDGEEYYRLRGFRKQSNRKFKKLLKSIYKGASDLDTHLMNSLLNATIPYSEAGRVMDQLVTRGNLNKLFQIFRYQNYKSADSIYLRSLAYKRKGNEQLAYYFLLQACLKDLENWKKTGDYRDYLGDFFSFYPDFGGDKTFSLLGNLIEKYPEQDSLRLDFSSLAREKGIFLEESLKLLQQIPKNRMQVNYYWVVSKVLNKLGRCKDIESLLQIKELEEPYRSATQQELDNCLSSVN
jgi:thioredoxin-related protein